MGSIGDEIVLVSRYVAYDERMNIIVFKPMKEYIMPAYFKQIDYKVRDVGDKYRVELAIHIQPSDKWSYSFYKCEIYGYPGGEIVSGEEAYSNDMPGNNTR